jgi:hypothetical protein
LEQFFVIVSLMGPLSQSQFSHGKLIQYGNPNWISGGQQQRQPEVLVCFRGMTSDMQNFADECTSYPTAGREI